MKAIIPVAGTGVRLRPLTYTQPKPLILIAGKPIISFIIDQLRSIGIEDFVFVIGYLGEKIQHFIEQTYPEINSTFVTQQSRQGSGHAIWTARTAFQDTDEVFIVFGDTIIDFNLQEIVQSPTSSLCVKKVEKPQNYGVVEYRKDGFAKRVVEKPRIPKSNMAMVGFYKITEVAALVNALNYNISNSIQTGNEFPLTDAIMRMINRGIPFSTITVDNWFNCGKREVLLETNAILLDKKGYASSHLPSYENSIIIHPVSIGNNCKITNSIVGPHVSIGDNAVLDSAIVRNSIIGHYASLNEVVLHSSVIGNDTAITGLRQSLNIGDNTEIDFSGK